MKKSELKDLIKPLIKECLKEVLIEEGFTKMLSESVNTSVQAPTKNNIAPIQATKPQALIESKKKMLDAIGNSGFDAFAGTEPLREDKEIAGGDPGIDISRLLENKAVWKQTLNAMNGKKVKE